MSDENNDEQQKQMTGEIDSLLKEAYSSNELFFEAEQHPTIKEVYKVLGDNSIGDPINSLIALERAKDFSQHCVDNFKMMMDTEFGELNQSIMDWKIGWDKRAGYSPDTDRLFGMVEQQRELYIRASLELVRAYELRSRAMLHLFKIVYSKNKNLSKFSANLDEYEKLLAEQLRVIKKIRQVEVVRTPEDEEQFQREEFDRREQTLDDVPD